MDKASQDMLPIYWSRLFPYNVIYKWLNYGQEELFSKREFVLNFGETGDRFLRNLSFNTIENLKTFIRKTVPNKIDIGAIYSKPFSSKSNQSFTYPIQKELVIDIDLTDYDDVRVCCSKAKICRKCWKYVIVAVKILDIAIREDFGYQHILWVFSGRRGVHAWICDKEARILSLEGRLAISNYLQLVQGGEYIYKKVHLREKIHHSERRALKIIDEVFLELAVIQQDMLGTDVNMNKFLNILQEEVRDEVRDHLNRYCTSLSRWKAFERLFNINKTTMKFESWINNQHLIDEIKLQYIYPRLDAQVTHSMNHLLKSPFSINPKTGIVGIAFDPKKIDEFDPFEIPTISALLSEVDKYCQIAKEMNYGQELLLYHHDLEKTVLKDSYRFFYNFVCNLVDDKLKTLK